MRILVILLCLFLLAPNSWAAKPAEPVASEEAEDKKSSEKDKAKMAEIYQRRLSNAVENLGARKYESLEKATYYLETMGKDAVPVLIKALRDDRKALRVKINIIHTLGRIGEEAERAVPAIVPYLSYEDTDARAVAAIAIKKIAPSTNDAVPYLGKLLNDKNSWVRNSAHGALKAIGTDEANIYLASHKGYDNEKAVTRHYFSN